MAWSDPNPRGRGSPSSQTPDQPADAGSGQDVRRGCRVGAPRPCGQRGRGPEKDPGGGHLRRGSGCVGRERDLRAGLLPGCLRRHRWRGERPSACPEEDLRRPRLHPDDRSHRFPERFGGGRDPLLRGRAPEEESSAEARQGGSPKWGRVSQGSAREPAHDRARGTCGPFRWGSISKRHRYDLGS
jgi:hypothetical protein